jgi:hypothetical protein
MRNLARPAAPAAVAFVGLLAACAPAVEPDDPAPDGDPAPGIAPRPGAPRGPGEATGAGAADARPGPGSPPPDAVPASSADAGVSPAGRTDGAGPGADGRASDAWAAGDGASLAPGSAVFDPTRLHEIAIEVEARYLAMLDSDLTRRVPCTFSFDGVVLANVGIRKKGGHATPQPLSRKPAFSVKTNELVRGQRLHGLDKLLLQNGVQDQAFLNEHLGYEVYRRAGLRAPRTSHAVVTFNGAPKGIYVIREAYDGGFLERAFGKGNAHGNLYEGPCCVDFVTSPEKVELKDELEEMRSREDLLALARVVRDTPSDRFADVVGARLDVPAFITSFAADALVAHWDGYAFKPNNYFLYHRPSDDRFVFLPHGMDSLFTVDGWPDPNWRPPRIEPLATTPGGRLAQRVRAIAELDARYRAELRRLLDDAWDVAALHARLDQVARLLRATTRKDAATLADLARFEKGAPLVRQYVADRKTRPIQ